MSVEPQLPCQQGASACPGPLHGCVFSDFHNRIHSTHYFFSGSSQDERREKLPPALASEQQGFSLLCLWLDQALLIVITTSELPCTFCESSLSNFTAFQTDFAGRRVLVLWSFINCVKGTDIILWKVMCLIPVQSIAWAEFDRRINGKKALFSSINE